MTKQHREELMGLLQADACPSDTLCGVLSPGLRDALIAQVNERSDEITLRDRFAAHALVGICTGHIDCWTDRELAGRAYMVSDEMLKAREVQPCTGS